MPNSQNKWQSPPATQNTPTLRPDVVPSNSRFPELTLNNLVDCWQINGKRLEPKARQIWALIAQLPIYAVDACLMASTCDTNHHAKFIAWWLALFLLLPAQWQPAPTKQYIVVGTLLVIHNPYWCLFLLNGRIQDCCDECCLIVDFCKSHRK